MWCRSNVTSRKWTHRSIQCLLSSVMYLRPWNEVDLQKSVRYFLTEYEHFLVTFPCFDSMAGLTQRSKVTSGCLWRIWFCGKHCLFNNCVSSIIFTYKYKKRTSDSMTHTSICLTILFQIQHLMMDGLLWLTGREHVTFDSRDWGKTWMMIFEVKVKKLFISMTSKKR
jgi:hypothetical protein